MSVDSKLEISYGGFLCWLMFSVRYFLIRDVEDAFNPTYLMGCSESNSFQLCFLCKHMVYLYAIQSTSWRIHISFLSIPWIVVHGRYYYSQPLFFYLFFPGFVFVYLLLFCFSFLTTKTMYSVREHWFTILILVKI